MIEDILEYFNKYAFVQVAVYGKDYYTAGKDTWNLCKTRGIDAIINDDLIGSVLFVGSLLTGILNIGGVAIYLASAGLIANTTILTVSFIVAFFVGIAEFGIVAAVIDSGVATTFVCIAEDPAALARTKPDLYREIQVTYPQIMLGF